jgi:hypothetical protein
VGDDDREALDVVNHVLGGGLSSRLFEEIREKRGLVYSVFSGISAYGDAGAYSIYAGAQPRHADEVIRLVRQELACLVEHGLSDDELDIAKGYLMGAFELGLEDTGARMSRNGGCSARPARCVPPPSRWRGGRRSTMPRPAGSSTGCSPTSRSSSPWDPCERLRSAERPVANGRRGLVRSMSTAQLPRDVDPWRAGARSNRGVHSGKHISIRTAGSRATSYIATYDRQLEHLLRLVGVPPRDRRDRVETR